MGTVIKKAKQFIEENKIDEVASSKQDSSILSERNAV